MFNVSESIRLARKERKKERMYKVNEIFYSVQGEGCRAGTANVFVRFSGCNLRCNEAEHGFDCDTEFVSGRQLSLRELVVEIAQAVYPPGEPVVPRDPVPAIIFTGGEPALQLDDILVETLKDLGHYLAVESNGTKQLPAGIDWICLSPKTAEHTIHHSYVNELRYVRRKGMGIPKPKCVAANYTISPAFQSDGTVKKEDLEWCIDLVKNNPKWRLSVQLHKLWSVR